MTHIEDADLNDPPQPAPPSPFPNAEGSSALQVDAEAQASLCALGFDCRSAQAALLATRSPEGKDSVEAAANWLFSQTEEGMAEAVAQTLSRAEQTASEALQEKALRREEAEIREEAMAAEKTAREAAAAQQRLCTPLQRSVFGLGDGKGEYRLRAFVTHLGGSVGGGHYVCYARREEKDKKQWLLFNDEKVLAVERAPVEKAYLLLFSRSDQWSV